MKITALSNHKPGILNNYIRILIIPTSNLSIVMVFLTDVEIVISTKILSSHLELLLHVVIFCHSLIGGKYYGI